MATSVRSTRTLHSDALEIEQADHTGVQERGHNERNNHAAEDTHPSTRCWSLLFGHVTPPSRSLAPPGHAAPADKSHRCRADRVRVAGYRSCKYMSRKIMILKDYQ
jgi:hypothetical protein